MNTQNNTTNPSTVTEQTIPFFRLAFRPFFWLGALFGIISIGLWSLSFTGHITFNPYGGSYFWHIHEMLFGFTVAIISGFILTAVQSWTSKPSVKGISLLLLVLLWVTARVLLLFTQWANDYLIAAIDIIFIPCVALFFLTPIIKAKKWRNTIFIPILLCMTIANTFMHLSVIGDFTVSYIAISHTIVLLISLIICLIAGRVFPMFTANGTQTEKVQAIAWLEKLSLFSIGLSVLAISNIITLPETVKASIFFIAGLSNFIRALRWRIWVTYKTPLVWSLHLSYWAICLGYFMLGLAHIEILHQPSLALHAITVGGISWMILSMVSRVSLGHTGRKIQIGKTMTIALLLMGFAFITRTIAPLFWSDYGHIVLLSSVFWVLSFSLFIIMYTPILFKARIDKKAG